LVQVPSGRELATFEHPSLDRIDALTFSPDGTKLVTVSNGSGKGNHVWDLRLVRQRLTNMGLDWDSPAFPQVTTSGGTVSVRIIGQDELVSWNTWCQRASAHFNSREWEKAIAAWTKAIELEPQHAQCWNDRGNAYSWLNRWDKALADYTEAIARAPMNPVYWSNRATAHGQLDQDELAVADLSKAIELRPDDVRFWIRRGGAHIFIGKLDKAAGDFEKAISLTPNDAHPRYLLAMARLQSGDRIGASKVCSEMLERFGDTSDSNAAYWTAWTHAVASSSTADWKAVVRLAGFALDAEPTNFDRMTVFGAALYRAGEFERSAKELLKAEAAFQRVKDARGTVVYTWLYLAMTEQRRGNVAEAQKYLQQAVSEIERPTLPKDPADKSWNRRLTLELLRAEAESTIRQIERGPPPRELKK
jgi:tetratricopeptide (TPR) repeat protein